MPDNNEKNGAVTPGLITGAEASDDRPGIPADAKLGGFRILLVEDEYLLSLHFKKVLQDAGAEVIGPHYNEDAARRSLKTQPVSAAVMDIGLGDGPTYPLVRELLADGVPVLLVTGYGRHMLPPDLAAAELLVKPIEPAEMVERLAAMMGHSAS